MSQLSFHPRTNSNSIIYFLIAFTIFINPLLEAPKNIAMVLTLLVVIYYGITEKKARIWSGWDLFFALYVIAYVVAAPFSAYHTDPTALTDIARYMVFGWVIYRADFNERQKLGLVFWAVFGTFIGLIYGAWDHYYLGNGQYWTLNSVGHVNHAAIYNAIICGMAITVLFTYWSRFTAGKRTLWLAMLALSLVYVTFGESRATFGAIIAVVLALSIGFARRGKRFLLLPIFFIIGFVGIALLSNARVIVKQENNAHADNILSYRATIWRSAINSIEQHPLFGVGKDNFHYIDIKWGDKTPIFNNVSHAHNLYINVLAESGIWGFCWVFGLLGAMGITLLRYLPKKNAPLASWNSWGITCSALVITLVVGLVNTPFHHETGNLTMLCFALWISQYRQDKQRFI